MAKFVVAGRSDCPYFSRVELLGDRLAKNLEKFELHKILIQPSQWDQWLKTTCAEKGWNFSKSPIVWRELIDRGGKGVLIGGANDFQEYVKAYYDLESEMNSYDMRTIAAENKITRDELDEEEQMFKAMSKPLNVCISNAAHPIAYHILTALTSGRVLGAQEEVTIRLLVSSKDEIEFATGMAMEVEDLAHGLVRGVTVCTSPHEAFENCSIIIMLDELLQQEEEKKVDWLKRNEEMFSRYATIINDKALKSCKVLLSGLGPLNFNTMMMIKNAPNLHRQNVIAVSTVIENLAKSVIGERLTVNPGGIVDLLVWGNINGSHYFDVSKCRVHNYDGAIWGPYWYSVDTQEMIHDKKWIIKEFPGLVEDRSRKVSEAMQHPTSLSAGNAICTALQYWFQGSPLGQIFSLGVYSEGWYGVPDGLVFSFPVTMDPKGYWHVVQDIEMMPPLKQALTEAIEDLTKEIGIFKGEISEDETKEEDKPAVEDSASNTEQTAPPADANAPTPGESNTPGNNDATAAENPANPEEEKKPENESTDQDTANSPPDSQPVAAEEPSGEANTENENPTAGDTETTEAAE